MIVKKKVVVRTQHLATFPTVQRCKVNMDENSFRRGLLCRINNQTCRHTYILSRVLAVLGPRRLESAELGPRLGPEGVELCRLEQDVALVHPSRHQDALLGWKMEFNDSIH